MSIPAKLRAHKQIRHVVFGATLLLAVIAMYSNNVQLWVMAFLLSNSYAWFLLVKDKRLARNQSPFRIPESSLWLSALCAGGIGAFLAMVLIRHKTKHLAFRVIFPIFMIFSIALFIFGLLQLL
ncbi:DUF1294 domain-containing protein [Bacillus horti]|uniref:Uncharacterized membrane protein YsdA (DUF1294 family) n=1 Tax=Caldalkalibacillus horti TaxID=77523 RepID=A0ABT9W468_9BACI|nr:DUF1294 domain-containing protein [Bacillus horti]MDQ0168037.1 uncharacterized membrane protein YsdA (DUF1294 family) [Bacillus horti]